MIIKKREVIKLHKELSHMKDYEHFRFTYAIERNIEKLATIIKPLEKIEMANLDIIEEYTKERIELCRTHCVKDDKGNPILVDDGEGNLTSFDFPKDKKDIFEKELNLLKQKHKEHIDTFDTNMKKLNEMLDNDDEEFIEYTIKLEHIPPNITKKDLSTVFRLLERKD